MILMTLTMRIKKIKIYQIPSMNKKEKNLNYTIILHSVRKELGLSLNEYCIADSIYHLSNNPSSTVQGWCYASRKHLGEVIGISEQAVYPIIEKLISLGLVEKNPETKYLRTTEKWYDMVVLEHSRNFSGTKETLVGIRGRHSRNFSPDTKETLVYNNIDNNISKDISTKNVDISGSNNSYPLISNLSPKQEKDDIFPKEYYKDIETIFQNELEKKYNLKYAFNYSKERTVLKRFTKLVLKKHPDWGLEEIVKRVPALITHWIENNEKETAPTITKVFSTNHLNEYRFWIAQNYPHKVKSSL